MTFSASTANYQNGQKWKSIEVSRIFKMARVILILFLHFCLHNAHMSFGCLSIKGQRRISFKGENEN